MSDGGVNKKCVVKSNFIIYSDFLIYNFLISDNKYVLGKEKLAEFLEEFLQVDINLIQLSEAA